MARETARLMTPSPAASPPAPTGPTGSSGTHPPSVWRIVRETLRDSPERTRTTAVVAIAMWAVLMVAQAFDSADRSVPAGIAEFLSALCGSAGGLLLGLGGILSAQADRRTAHASVADQEAFRTVLLALPVVSLMSAALLSAAVVLLIVRATLGVPVVFVGVLGVFFTVLLVLSGAVTLRATRALYAHARREASAAADARHAARDAQLSALQMRMNPHFLFNALNTVAALVRTSPADAERVTENLSHVLRRTLVRSAERMGCVRDEVSYVRAWLELEQVRWQDRLCVDWKIDPGVDALDMPPLVLQPLVENALRHAVGSRIEGGRISVSITARDGMLEMSVADDGPGFPPHVVERTGLGTLRERLAALYGAAAELHVESSAGGATVTARWPAGSEACAS